MESAHFKSLIKSVIAMVASLRRDEAMNVTYELRTQRNARVFAYESLQRAKDERIKAEKRVGVKMHIIKITHMEEVLHD